MGYQPLPIEAYYWPDGTLCCGECAGKITAYDVSCPHCGKRFTRRSPLKFGGYTSRDMLPEKVEQGLHARTATIRVMKRIEQDIAVREQDQAFLNEIDHAIKLCELGQATRMARLIDAERLLMEES